MNFDIAYWKSILKIYRDREKNPISIKSTIWRDIGGIWQIIAYLKLVVADHGE
jgi:hypothetical protein